jgi:hypothetical protein
VVNSFSSQLPLKESFVEDVGSILPKALNKHLSCAKSRVVEVLAPVWGRIVGKLVAQQSRPVRYSDGTLVISAYSPPWAAQLAQMADQIRSEVNAFLAAPVVRKIRVRCQPDAKPECSQIVVSRVAGPPDCQPDEMKRLLWADGRTTLDPELVRVVERSFMKYFSRNGKRQCPFD